MDETKKSLAKELEEYNMYCNGTNDWHKHWLGRLLYTDGIKLIAEYGSGAHWFIDAIASYQSDKLDKQCDGFQLWHLKPNGKGGAILTCQRDSGEKEIVRQEIEYSSIKFDDFDDEGLRVWVRDVGDPPKSGQVAGRVLLLPSEN